MDISNTDCCRWICYKSERQKNSTERKSSKKNKMGNIWLFAIIFFAAGLFSELARKNDWYNRGAFNLFENMYRFGSLVFGGGQVLIPMMYEQFVERPTSPVVQRKNQDKAQSVIKIDRDDFYIGAGMVRAIPGPVFSIAAFTGGVALKERGSAWQTMGCLIGSMAIFLPSALLVLFFSYMAQFEKICSSIPVFRRN